MRALRTYPLFNEDNTSLPFPLDYTPVSLSYVFSSQLIRIFSLAENLTQN